MMKAILDLNVRRGLGSPVRSAGDCLSETRFFIVTEVKNYKRHIAKSVQKAGDKRVHLRVKL
jgi:hypothetical protein